MVHDTVLCPVAQLELQVDGVPVCVEAAVSELLPVQVLLGTDVYTRAPSITWGLDYVQTG